MNPLKIGQFVTVGNDLGIIVGLANDPEIPEEHLGIWYGQETEDGKPKARTVPEEYCIPVEEVSYHH